MAIPITRERIDYGSPDGSAAFGVARQVIEPAGTARTLLVSESGALCVFGTAAGQAYTLPALAARDVGCEFEFVATITGTGTYSVTTDAGTTFIGGGMASITGGMANLPAPVSQDSGRSSVSVERWNCTIWRRPGTRAQGTMSLR